MLAADSRVTLTAQVPGQNLLIPATYDNATKLLRVANQDYVGVVTYGLGAIGQQQPRTAHSFIPEFESELKKEKRLPVETFAKKLSGFFVQQWNASMPKDHKGPDMVFLVGGYDEGAPYGRVFEFSIPTRPTPKEWHAGQGEFGIVWGGQREFADRVMQGFDDSLPQIVQQFLKLSDQQRDELRAYLKNHLGARIPYAFLPLQDCVDLAIFILRTTIAIQGWWVDVRGVGGAIDVATITRTNGFQPIQQKTILGER
ncbi:MAG: hypothetical protein ACE5G6_05675 [Terriglobia bacterium]